MAESQPPTGNHKPNDIHQRGADTRTRFFYDLAPERPKYKTSDPERSHTRGDSDDKNTGDNTRQNVSQEQPKAAQNNPDNI